MAKIDETVDKLRQLKLNSMADHLTEAIEQEKNNNQTLKIIFFANNLIILLFFNIIHSN